MGWHPNDRERLLSLWARYFADRQSHGYPTRNALDGNLALLETRRYNRRSGTPANGVESRRVADTAIHIDEEAEEFDRLVMRQIKSRSPERYNVLALYACNCSVRTIAQILNLSRTTANDMKNESLAMVDALI